MNINLELGKKSFVNVVFNQIDKNVDDTITLENYTFKTGDIAKIEWYINGHVYIQTDITITGNVLSFKRNRNVTAIAGTGTFNVAIENATNNYRQATLKEDFKVIKNSINEDDVSEELAENTIEQLQNEETKANTVKTALIEATDNADLNNYAKKTDLEEYSKTKDIESTYATKKELTQSQKDFLDLAHPIGCYMDFKTEVDPNILYPWQTWERDISGTVLVSSTNDSNDSDFGTVDITGGSKTQQAGLSNTAFAQIAIPAGSSRVQAKQVDTPNWNANINLSGSSTDNNTILTQAGVNVAGTTNEFNNCMPYKISNRWYRTA